MPLIQSKHYFKLQNSGYAPQQALDFLTVHCVSWFGQIWKSISQVQDLENQCLFINWKLDMENHLPEIIIMAHSVICSSAQYTEMP